MYVGNLVFMKYYVPTEINRYSTNFPVSQPTATHSYHSNEPVVIARRITLATAIDSLGDADRGTYLSYSH